MSEAVSQLGMWTRLSVLVVASGVGAFAGIRAHEAAVAGAASASASVAEAPVEAPTGLVAEGVLPSPDVTWRKTQRAIGGVVMLAPPTFAGLLGAWARIPSLATVIDGATPAYGAIGADGRWVIAAHAITASLARSTLLADGGSEAMKLESHAGSIDVLHGGESTSWIGLAGEWVLVGSDRDAVVTLGPYAYRTLPTRALPPNALSIGATQAALAGPIKSQLDKSTNALERFLVDKDEEERQAHGGRSPDLADPKPIVAALAAFTSRYSDAISGMQRADLVVDVDDDGASGHLTLTPPASGAAKAFVDHVEGGGTLPLATANADALATIYWRTGRDERDEAAESARDLLMKSLGARVPAADVAKIGDSFVRIAHARAGWALLSASSGSSAGILLRVPTSDPASVTGAIESDIDIARKPTWAKWEDDALSIKKIDRTENAAAITTAQTTLQAKWMTLDNDVELAVGLDASALLAPPARTIRSDAQVSAWLRDLRGDVSWAVIARPLLVESSPRGDPALVALARRGNGVVLEARASGVILRRLFSSSKAF
jgi:hypothetical protein